MCGITGTFAYHPAALQADRDELRAMRDHMIARGPDGFGEWFSEHGRVGLGHRRLAIIDLSERGAQPMASADGQLVVVFNGEIYNYRALRQELENQGRVFKSDSDTEVLLHLYALKGPAMLHELRGMFAFSLWDAQKQALFMARDPYGIKPLYYADDGWTLRFASQVKALLAGNKVSRMPEPAGQVGFYLFGSVPEPYTLYQEIRALPAGHSLWVDSAGPREPQQYFSISSVWAEAEQAEPVDPGSLQEIVREAVLDSVRHHMVADVPVGTFLSAGIDSGALLGLMSEVRNRQEPPSPVTARSEVRNLQAAPGPVTAKSEVRNLQAPLNPVTARSKATRQSSGTTHGLQAITLAFDEFRNTEADEAPLAEVVANHYGACHTVRVVGEQEFHADLPRILEAMDQPSIDGINTWFVSKAAHEAGLKVAVSGVGGDELFGGYPSFRDLPRWARALWLPTRIPGLGALAEQVQAAFAPLFPRLNPKAVGMLRYGGSYPGGYLLRRGLFLPRELPQLLGEELAREGLRRLESLALIQSQLGSPPPRRPYGIVASLEAALYMRNQLLRDTDWASMAHSLEVRTPLVDAWLLRRLAGPLAGAKAGNQKHFLSGIQQKPLPAEITRRAKSGFTTPIADWQQRGESVQAWRKYTWLANARTPWARRWSVDVMTVGWN